MSNQEELLVGQSKFGPRFQKTTYHKLEAGNNYFRILPPLFSLAAEGKYAEWWEFHGGFKNSEGIAQLFRCVQVKKDKLVTQHCPVCDEVTQLNGRYNQLKEAAAAGQTTREAVKEFHDKNIFPIQVQKRFFVNAISQDGTVGLLALAYKAYKSLDSAMNDAIKQYQIDPTGTQGAWMNIKKVQPFKGSPDVSYGAELALEQTAAGLNFKRHQLTPQFIQENVKVAARDLKTLYRSITLQEVAQLVSVPRSQVAPIVDKIFAKKEVNAAASPLTTSVPGTQATLIGRVETAQDGTLDTSMPTMPVQQAPTPNANGFAAPAPTNANPNGFAAPTNAGPVNNYVAPPLQPPPTVSTAPTFNAPAAPTNPNAFGGAPVAQPAAPGLNSFQVQQPPVVSGISDQDFNKVFGNQ